VKQPNAPFHPLAAEQNEPQSKMTSPPKCGRNSPRQQVGCKRLVRLGFTNRHRRLTNPTPILDFYRQLAIPSHPKPTPRHEAKNNTQPAYRPLDFTNLQPRRPYRLFCLVPSLSLPSLTRLTTRRHAGPLCGFP
jgi:hypothetical protein